MRNLLLTVVAGLGIMAVTGFYFRPRAAPEGAYKFLHCDICQFELVYSKKLAGQRCPHCQPPTIGKLTPSVQSIHDGGAKPWKPFNIALSVEAVCLLGAIVYLLYRPRQAEQLDFLYMLCPKCDRRLRYLAKRAGGDGQCPNCKSMIGYPIQTTD